MEAARAIDIEDVSRRAETVTDELRAGRRLELVQDGRRIGEIVPCDAVLTGAEREAAWHDLKAVLQKGFNLGGWNYQNRAELYERD